MVITEHHGKGRRSGAGGALDKDPLVPKEGWQEARAKPLHTLPAGPGCQAVWGVCVWGGNLILGSPRPLRPIALTPIPCLYTRPSAKFLPHRLSACLEPSFPGECRPRHWPTGAPTPTGKQQERSPTSHNCPPRTSTRTASPETTTVTAATNHDRALCFHSDRLLRTHHPFFKITNRDTEGNEGN